MDASLVRAALAARYQAWDELVSSTIFNGLRAIGISDASKPASRITKDLPFVDSPTPAVTAILAYLVIVTIGSAVLRRKASTRGPDPAWLRFLVQVSADNIRRSGMLCTAFEWRCAQHAATNSTMRLLSQVHNVVLIVLSAGMAASSVYWARAHNYSFWGNAYRASERNMGLTIYVFYMSKFYEFFDTVRGISCWVLPACTIFD